MKHQDQQPIGPHSSSHYYYVRNNFTIVEETKVYFTFLHYANAYRYAKIKTIPCSIYNSDNIKIKDFSKIHEF